MPVALLDLLVAGRQLWLQVSMSMRWCPKGQTVFIAMCSVHLAGSDVDVLIVP